jgi:O-antigen/teichoic acid export membrane protein
VAGLGATAIALTYAVPVGVGCVVALLWLLRILARAEHRDRRVFRRLKKTISIKRLGREFWRFSLPRWGSDLAFVLLSYLSTLLVGGYLGTRDTGIYAASTRFVLAGSIALPAVIATIAPQISAMVTLGRYDRAEALYRTSTWWLMIPSFPIYIVTIVFAPFLLRMFGTGFDQGDTVLVILAAAMLVSMATGPISQVLLMSGHSVINLANTVLALILNVALMVILIPRMGINGAAIAWAASIVLINIVPVVECWVLLGIKPFGVGFPIVALASAVCYGVLGVVVRITFGMTVVSFLAYGAVSTILFLAVLVLNRRTLQLAVLMEGLRRRGRRPGPRPGGAAESAHSPGPPDGDAGGPAPAGAPAGKTPRQGTAMSDR